MKKENFEKPTLEVIEFNSDVITTSGCSALNTLAELNTD